MGRFGVLCGYVDEGAMTADGWEHARAAFLGPHVEKRVAVKQALTRGTQTSLISYAQSDKRTKRIVI